MNRLYGRFASKLSTVWPAHCMPQRWDKGAKLGRWLLCTFCLWCGVEALLAQPHSLAQGTVPTDTLPIFLPWVSNVPTEIIGPNGLPRIFISEFMAGNRTTLLDEDGDSSDWVEIANISEQPIHLQGWSLTDNPQKLTKWRFPNVVISPHSYLVVFASDKNRTSDPAHLHTNFKLSRYGGYLALTKPDGKTIAWQYGYDSLGQYPDVSYGVDQAGYERYLLQPSPGAPNGTGAQDQRPALAHVHHQPEPVRVGQDIKVTATTAAATPLQVWLHYCIMYNAVVTVPMLDDGLHNDGAAHDGVYGAAIPANSYTTGQMVRYFVTVTDSANRTARLPLFLDPTDQAEYYGTVIQPDYTGSPLPVVHWFVQDYAAATTDAGTRAALYYAGEFYDNVAVRQRGDYTRKFKKKSFKFDLTKEHPFQFSPQEHRVTEINLNSTYTDRAALRPILAWDTYRDAGVPYSISFPVRMQRNGAFYSVALFVEQPDEDYLARQGLDPTGALYKLHISLRIDEQGGVEKKTRHNEDDSDYQAFRAGLFLPGEAGRRFLYDNVNLPEVLNYLAVTALVQDNDAIVKNYYLYRDSNNTGEWQMLPWDKDLTFGRMYTDKLLSAKLWPNTDPYSHPLFGDAEHPRYDGDWNQLINALYDVSEFRLMYLRRLRTLMDQLLQTPETPYAQRYYETRLDTLVAQVQSDIALDAAAWPPDWATTQTFAQAVASLKNDYLIPRRVHLFHTHGPGGDTLIPTAQPANVPINFGEVGRDMATLAHNQEYFTLVNPNNVAVDISGWQITGGVAYTFQPGVVIPAGGTLYVAASSREFRHRATGPRGGESRFVQGGYSGRLSTASGSLSLKTSAGVVVATLGLTAP